MSSCAHHHGHNTGGIIPMIALVLLLLVQPLAIKSQSNVTVEQEVTSTSTTTPCTTGRSGGFPLTPVLITALVVTAICCCCFCCCVILGRESRTRKLRTLQNAKINIKVSGDDVKISSLNGKVVIQSPIGSTSITTTSNSISVKTIVSPKRSKTTTPNGTPETSPRKTPKHIK